VSAYLLRRAVFALSVILAVTLITFAMGQVLPGDPARSAAGLNARPEQIEAARVRLGLDDPLHEQYLAYLARVAGGDLGTSIFTNRPITADLSDRLPASIELVLFAMMLVVLIGVPLGVLAAVRRGPIDATTRLGVLVGAAIPVFWLALMLQFIFSAQLNWFPLVGRIDLGMDPGPRITGLLLIDTAINGRWDVWFSAVRHLLLPAVTLSVLFIAVVARTTRASMARVLDEDYLQYARAKGVPERRVITRHALRNALIPIVTIVGLQFGWMLASTVLVESVFGFPGIGSYAVTAVLQTDIFAVTAVVLIIAIVFVVANLVVDGLIVGLNPRIRLSGPTK
jgi:peptide/nickel transport system permease protein